VVLKPSPGYDERRPNLSKRINAVTLSGQGDAPKSAFVHDDRLRPKQVVAGLRIGSNTKAFPFSELRIVRVVNNRVGGVPVLVATMHIHRALRNLSDTQPAKPLIFQLVPHGRPPAIAVK
jgi:hypothetical protein